MTVNTAVFDVIGDSVAVMFVEPVEKRVVGVATPSKPAVLLMVATDVADEFQWTVVDTS